MVLGVPSLRGLPTLTGMILIAHAGHVLTTIAYFVPVVGFLVWLAVTQIRERRRAQRPPT
jgi:hypothetical protein